MSILRKIPLVGALLKSALDAAGHKIENLGEPTNPHDAATKEYVDENGGGESVKLDDEVTETSENGVKSKGIWSFVKGLFGSLATVATSGSYNDLSDKPTIPEGATVLTVGGGKIYKGGVELTSYAALLALVQAGGVTLMGTVGADKDALFYPLFCDDNAIRFDATGTLGGDVKTKSYTVQPANGDHIRVTEGSLVDLAKKSDIPDVSGFYKKPSTGIPKSDLASGVVPDVVAPASDTAFRNKAADAYETGKKLDVKTDAEIVKVPSTEDATILREIDGFGIAFVMVHNYVGGKMKTVTGYAVDLSAPYPQPHLFDINFELGLGVTQQRYALIDGEFVFVEVWDEQAEGKFYAKISKDGVPEHKESWDIQLTTTKQLSLAESIASHDAGGLTDPAKAALFTDTAFKEGVAKEVAEQAVGEIEAAGGKLVVKDDGGAEQFNSEKAVRYALVNTASTTLADMTVTKVTLTGATTTIAIPTAPVVQGRVMDFEADVTNTTDAEAVLEFTGLETAFSFVTDGSSSVADETKFAAGEHALLLFTQIADKVIDETTSIPCFLVAKKVVK